MTEINGYTLAQFDAFSMACVRSKQRRQRDQAVNLRAAQYDQGDWSRYIKQLEKDI
ncbi:hypothetical protein [Lysobacter enzymogenes]|uniref:hypothetical protein n=1 Tax=Lysobacter enzymogenes TaxID=69 RepID=UPI0018E948B8|nr:hypothetical protein [Lysobacter enzymogenes]UZW62762.1 hypothetical protein BV903_010910 [Lysobacter enzymogenes]